MSISTDRAVSMRVLFVSNHPHLPDIHGGLQTTTHDLCLAIKEMGAEPAVLCGLGEHRTSDCSTIEDQSLGYLVMRDAAPEKVLAKVASVWDATVIVVQTGTTLVPMVIQSLATDRPTAVYLHNVEPQELAGTLVPTPSLRYFANSLFTAQRWRALCGIDCCVIPPIVAPKRYLAERTGQHVLFVNPTPIKGVEIMFALAAACPDLPFLVYESWNLAPRWRDHCLSRAKILGNITWRRPTQDMREAYTDAKMLLMPSIWEESFGRTVIEAQLNGLPVLASNRGALPALVGDSGLIVDAHAPIAEWAGALRQLHEAPSAWGANARRRAVAHIVSTPLVVGRLLTELAVHANSS